MKIKLEGRDYIYLGFIALWFIMGVLGLHIFLGVTIGALYGFIMYKII